MLQLQNHLQATSFLWSDFIPKEGFSSVSPGIHNHLAEPNHLGGAAIYILKLFISAGIKGISKVLSRS